MSALRAPPGIAQSATARLSANRPSAQPRLEPHADTASLPKPGEPGEIVIKVLRTKWEAQDLKLTPGDCVTIGLKSYKLLRS